MRLILNIIRLILWGPVRKTVSFLPPAFLVIIERLLAMIAYRLLSGRRELLLKELARCFGGKKGKAYIDRAVRDSFRIYVSSQIRLFYLPRLNSSNIARYISVEGLQYLDQELEKGKGAIILNPHFGPFMMIMPALGYRGYKLNQMALQGEPPWGARQGLDKKVYDMKFRSVEGNMPVKFINAASGTFSLREAIKALKNNEIVFYPSTGMGGTVFHPVGLMGRRIMLSMTPFNAAKKTGASLLPAFVINEGAMIKLKIEKAVESDTAEVGAEAYARILDEYVTKYPEHFAMYIYEVNKNIRMGGTPFFAGQEP
ncbi:MAG: lysophospholipid acyltransferase family protein [Deltaproteobacteria bacterium]|nr:lysophospholipid acyltransferase family protein [Deltaproteobacteria bacterium]